MIISKRTATRRATQSGTKRGGSAGRAAPAVNRGVPPRALADGVIERRRSPRRPTITEEPREPWAAKPAPGEQLPALLSPQEHYRAELERRGRRVAGDLQSLLAEAKAEYEAMLAAPRPAGKGGRPKKKPKAPDEFDLGVLGDEAVESA